LKICRQHIAFQFDIMYFKSIHRPKDSIKNRKKGQKAGKNTDKRYHDQRFLLRKYEIGKIQNTDYYHKNQFGDKGQYSYSIQSGYQKLLSFRVHQFQFYL